MRNTFKTFTVLAFLVFAAFAFAAGGEANFHEVGAAAENAAADVNVAPQDLYIRNCARCHGGDGAGETDLGQKLDVPDLSIIGSRLSVAKITRVVQNGKGEMPAYGKKLTKKQIAQIAAYVRKL